MRKVGRIEETVKEEIPATVKLPESDKRTKKAKPQTKASESVVKSDSGKED